MSDGACVIDVINFIYNSYDIRGSMTYTSSAASIPKSTKEIPENTKEKSETTILPFLAIDQTFQYI